MENKTYNVDDIFEDIPGDPDNVIMKIPPEILEQSGWKTGDTLLIEAEEGRLILKKKDE
jgi:bifunctional DNA-binding transcriptional regulator/antitoxin component of YhaV-PrlF toxin-antitoxin module